MRVQSGDRHVQYKKERPSADWWGTKGGSDDGGGDWEGWLGCLNVTGSEVK